MFERLSELETLYEEVQSQLADPAVTSSPERLKELGKRNAELEPAVLSYREWKAITSEIEGARGLIRSEDDGEMRQLAEQEVTDLSTKLQTIEEKLKAFLIPKDPLDERDVICEVRAGEGGDESALFAGEIYRMYTRYAERRKWNAEVLSSNPAPVGGFKEVTFSVKGSGAYSRLRHEAGVHRVQRVPATESQGRIHTSAVGVLILVEAEPVDIQIDQKDIKFDVFRSSGPGGQSVNTTDSAVRLTHLPTGIVATCQDEKSQLQNREKAMRILRARLYDTEMAKQAADAAAARRSQVRTVDRSEKIRTYNYPQNRVTDHRVKVTVHNLTGVMDGDLDELVEALIERHRTEQMKASNEIN